MVKNSSLDNLAELFDKEKRDGLIDIKFFPLVDVQTTRESFAKGVLDVLQKEEDGKFKIITDL